MDSNKLLYYLESTINSVFKILPLYEEKSVGIKTYVDSLLFELYGLEKNIDIDISSEYISLLSTLESIKTELDCNEDKKSVIKREVFKCINIIKNMTAKIEDGLL